MSWQTLSAQQLIRPHVTSKRELDELRGVVARDLADAALVGLSADRRFATAYNAALQTAKMAIACAGYRVAGLGHHQTSFEAAEIALGAQSASFTAYFDACRRKRNTVDYDRAYVASETEADQVLDEAKKFWR
ncbi:hypothetical protein CCAX7_29020 [Capsulimonas corticalis]|uniref:Uncharacterized protein n=1 Tax=Capsulimonas corticalis TaxID=2219043 RepID=A0A402CT46_9BACT|nr:hypothetical protein [Capsulimonas corticalis]BDI30851.1 hypothetical protein CCAX7_29020 [Capsulimonas corticalis]